MNNFPQFVVTHTLTDFGVVKKAEVDVFLKLSNFFYKFANSKGSRLKLKKVGKTTRPFRYDPNQIPYDYTVEVRNRFKGLDLIECLMNYGQRFVTLYRRQESRPSPWKRNGKKQNGCLGRTYK